MSSRTLLPLALLALLGLGAVFVLLSEEDAAPDVTELATEQRSTSEPARSLPEVGAGRDDAGRTSTDATQLALGESVVTRIVGRVIDRAARPIAGAQVRVLRQPDNVFEGWPELSGQQATSDADGEFTLLNLPTNTKLAVLVSAEGHAPSQKEGVRLNAGQTRDLGVFRLGTGLSLIGTIRNEFSEPLAGAQIRVADVAQQDATLEGQPALVGEATSDEQGRYRVPHLGRRQYEIQAEAEGHASVSAQLTFVLGHDMTEWKHDLVLESATTTLGGQLLDPDEFGVAGATVQLARRPDLSTTSFFRAETLTDDEGRFLFDALPVGEFDVSVVAAGWYLPRAYKLESGREDHRLYVRPAITIFGELISESAPPPTRFHVRVRPEASTGAGTLPGVSPARDFDVPETPGLFEMSGLKPGAYSFEVQAEGFALATGTQVVVGASQSEANVVIPLRIGGTLTGSVVPNTPGTSVELREGDYDPSLSIEATFPTRPIPGLVAEVDEDGRFEIRHVAAGTYVVTARPPEGPPTHLREVLVEEGLQTHLGEIRLARSGGLRGQVRGADGQPAGNSRVSISSAEGGYRQVTADLDGRYELLGLPEGSVRVSASPPGLWEALKYEASAETEIVAEEIQELDLELSERGGG